MVRKRNGIPLRLGMACLLGFALVSLAGCAKPKGIVNGKVTFKDGKAVSPGTIVTFWGSDNQMAPAVTGADGAYTVPDAPVGDVQITIVAPAAINTPPPPGSKGDAVPPKILPIPPKYKDKISTPEKYKVEAGTHEHNITIEP